MSSTSLQQADAAPEQVKSVNRQSIQAGRARARSGWVQAGFTLVELLVVMAIIGTLLTLAVPRYFQSVERSKEAVLRQNLATMRDSIDKHYADTGRYPETLEELVTKKYLRQIPIDPITESNVTWIVLAPEDPQKGVVYDVRSGAQARATDGTTYGEW